MSNAFLGQITMFGGNFAPRHTAFCNGQTLSIGQNQALFSLLGTFYGGNGQTTFALPNLQSRVPIHQGQGVGLSPYTLGQNGGTPSVTIDQSTYPIHLHTVNAANVPADSPSIANNKLPATPNTGSPPAFYCFQGNPPLPALVPHPMAPGACPTVGSSQAHDNMMPTLCITFVIFLQGIFPSRN